MLESGVKMGHGNGLKMRRFVDIMKIIGIVVGTLLVLAIVIIMINEARMDKKNQGKTAPLPIPTEEGAGISLPTSVLTEDEIAPTTEQIEAYRVAANKPRYIRIPDLSVWARIVEVGVQGDAMGAPGNIYDVGWYYKSSLPGETGAVLMDGHGGGGNYPGVVFDKLGDLEVGARIEIEMGDGYKFNYVVREKKILDIAEANNYMSKMLDVVDGAKQGLNLISCTGTWLLRQSTLDKRVMIRAVLEV